MFKLPYLPAAMFSVLFLFGLTAAAQTESSDEKTGLILELVALLKTEEQMKDSTNAYLESFEASTPEIIKRMSDGMTGLSATERTKLEERTRVMMTNVSKVFRVRISREVDYKSFIREQIVPIYERAFTISEIRDLIAFYKTPTGQKSIDSMPTVLREALAAASKHLEPQFMKIVDEIVTEELGKLGQQEN